MIRLTVALSAALYAGFVIWGDGDAVAISEGEVDAPAPATTASASFETPVIITGQEDGGAVVTRAALTEAVVPNAAAIAASAPRPQDGTGRPRLIGEPTVVSLVQPNGSSPTATAIPNAEIDDLLRVTGSRVNMRAGPSTANPVVGSMTEGALAERLSEERNGWVEIRDVVSGRTGFMAARFLAPS